MSRRVLFNGAVLVRPGAATKIDASQFESVILAGLGTVALIGSADGGTPRTVKVFNSATGVKTEYRSGNLVEAAALVADPSNDPRITAGAQVIVCYKVNNSTQSSLTKTPHLFKSKEYGIRANLITLAAAAAAATLTDATTAVSANTLTKAAAGWVVNAYQGMWVVDSASAVFFIVSNDATNIIVNAGGATPAAGAFNVYQYHPFARITTLTAVDTDGVTQTETSPLLGGTGKFTIRYTGAGSKCSCQITSTQLITVVTAGPGGENLTLNFSDFPTLEALVAYIDGLAVYQATALVTNAPSFLVVNLDTVTVADIAPIAVPIMATSFDIGTWENANSAFITDTVTLAGNGNMVVFTATNLTGGTWGTSDNTAWTNGFAGIAGLRCNQVVPLASDDGATEGGGTYTISSILAAAVAHAKLLSSTKGRSERQAWVGMKVTKTTFISNANTQNSEHLCLLGQKILRNRTSDGVLTTFPEWAAACLAAGMRGGAPLGEPLTWKYVNCLGVVDDVSWSSSNSDDVTDLLLNGCFIICEIKGKGWRIEKGITTYTKSENDAYIEETIVQNWKLVGYDLRTTLEDRYTGRPGTLDTVKTVPATCISVLELHRGKTITDGLVDGKVVLAYRNIAVDLNGDVMGVGVTISPTPGINFILNTIVLMPVRIQVSA